ncbi:dnaJ-like protein 60 isoform X2 [Anopheles albimanus]|uniref:dnaJ-like protein 60 isoform X2 n=1 Tax=Anopheles albimanus TaxID=7167 RepID=UPI00163E768D|nr:dnaJ-like protein 60 isoform X2 [Anopheles albimanus]
MLKVSPRSSVYKIFQTSSISCRYAHRTHYAVLKLQPDCSAREVRAAFIQLSKELHPDANVGSSRKYDNKSFVELLEAYKILSKPDSRAAYDYELSLGRDFKTNDQPVFHRYLLVLTDRLRKKHNASYSHDLFKFSSNRPWASGPKHYSTEEQPYYGIKGVKKVSNWTIVVFCAIFMLFGIVLQTVAISKSFTFKRNQLDEFSRQNAIQHAEVREEAEKYGNKAQIERMKAKLNKEVV